jgi:hypothetical protein
MAHLQTVPMRQALIFVERHANPPLALGLQGPLCRIVAKAPSGDQCLCGALPGGTGTGRRDACRPHRACTALHQRLPSWATRRGR